MVRAAREKLAISTIEQRHAYLEKQLAAARGVPVHHVPLQSAMPMAVWEFKRAVPLLGRGVRPHARVSRQPSRAGIEDVMIGSTTSLLPIRS